MKRDVDIITKYSRKLADLFGTEIIISRLQINQILKDFEAEIINEVKSNIETKKSQGPPKSKFMEEWEEKKSLIDGVQNSGYTWVHKSMYADELAKLIDKHKADKDG